MHIIETSTPEMWIKTATTAIVNGLVTELEKHQLTGLALSGGSTPYPVYRALSANSDLDWGRIGLVQVDERFVPVESPEYNWSKTIEALGSDIEDRVPQKCWFDTSISQEDATVKMDSCLPSSLGLSVLGMGSDGHIASLFPGGVWESSGKALATQAVGYPTIERLSLTGEYIQKSHTIILLLRGNEKKQCITEFMRSKDVSNLPVSLLFGHPNSHVIWAP